MTLCTERGRRLANSTSAAWARTLNGGRSRFSASASRAPRLARRRLLGDQPFDFGVVHDAAIVAIELFADAIAQGQQEVGVQPGVAHLGVAQRAASPVGALLRLVELHVEVPIEHRGQAHAVVTQRRAGDARVEQVLEAHAVAALEQGQVELPVVQHLDHVGIGEHRSQSLQVHVLQGIDQVVLIPHRELHQADALLVALQQPRHALAIGDHRRRRQVGQ
jgi:hypothetical protein